MQGRTTGNASAAMSSRMRPSASPSAVPYSLTHSWSSPAAFCASARSSSASSARRAGFKKARHAISNLTRTSGSRRSKEPRMEASTSRVRLPAISPALHGPARLDDVQSTMSRSAMASDTG